jgi:hypothetical protein
MITSVVRVRVVALGVAVGLLAAWPGAAQAQLAQPAVVSENPADFTPNLASDGVVPDPAVYALAQSGTTMYAGGQFHAIQNSTRTTTYTRSNLFSFGATTGAVTSFAPVFNGFVWALQPSGTSLYVGGEFTTVNGATRVGLAKIDAVSGALDPNFKPVVVSSGYVKEIRLVGGRLIVSGSFPKRLAALDPATGADTGYLNLAIAGSVASNAGPTHIYRFAVNPAGTRLVAVGNFTTVNGATRARAFMVDLSLTSPVTALDPWYYPPLTRMCAAASLPGYMRDVDFSPDGSYFVFVSTGFVSQPGDLGSTLCDAAARFDTLPTPTNPAHPAQPKWINYTGGDTLHSVAVTGVAVYVNGHNRWLDNPNGRDSAGPGAVSRPGIGAIDPTTGKALTWNPTKTRGVGGKDLLATSTGLWVASDGQMFHGEFHWGIAFVPLP